MQIAFTKSALPEEGAIVLPVFEDGLKEEAVAALDNKTHGALMRAAATANFSGKREQTVDVIAPSGLKNSRILMIGAGKKKELSASAAEAVGGAAAARLMSSREKSASFALEGFHGEKVGADVAAAHLAQGFLLRAYRFDKYKTKVDKDKKPQLAKIALHTPATKAKALFVDLEKVADGVRFARDLVTEPPNILYPESFARRCAGLESLGVKVTTLGVKEMKKLGMGALLGVGQGSVRESKLVALEWMGGKAGAAPVALIGKGVCFDTGGISIKPAAGMEDMKYDMGGAAAVAGTIMALASRKAKANVVGVLGLVENMPDGNAQRPSDVVTSMSGQTIEVINTDAEGRLVLADAIWWAQETYKPAAVVDLATLTGAILVSLAHEYAGLFSKHDDLAAQLLKAGETTGEKLWRMPLDKAHDDVIKSDIADMKNTGPREGGSSNAAAFIARFVKNGVPWAHLDIAGMAWTTKDLPLVPKGATGYGVRLLNDWIRTNHE
ncbi:MAG: leucyl aminopeptidase [Parvularculaceae bacterium]|nr:leucyl aminopeptidase [Parvularculaceae bacterium]